MGTWDLEESHKAPHCEIVSLFRVNPEEKEFQ